MAKRNPPKLRTDLSRGQAVAYFLRLMERYKDRRQALSRARRAVDSSIYRDVLPRLISNPTYRWAVVGDPFPSSPSRIQKKIQLEDTDIRREFVWSAEVIHLLRDQLRDFVQCRVSYEHAFLNAKYADAKEILDGIESKFGWSIWLIASRIQLLAISEGLQSQKKFLEDFLAQNVNPVLGWVSYYCSLRSEENYSLTSIQEVIDGIWHNQSLRDYAIYRLNPYSITQIGEAKNLLSWEEVNPIIDRLHAHLVASRIYLSGKIEDDDRKAIVDSLELIRDINDPEIDCLLGKPSAISKETGFDQYILGEYTSIIASASSQPELLAAAALHTTDITPPGKESVTVQVAKCMADMLLPSDSYIRSRQQLQKLALICGHLPVTRQIASFIARRDAESAWEPTARRAQLYSSLGEDVGELCLSSFTDNAAVELDGRILPPLPATPSQTVAMAILNGEVDGLPELMSPWRKSLYRAHILLNKGEIEEAERAFLYLSSSLVPYMVCLARVGLFRCSLAKGDIVSAAEQAVAHSLQAPDVFRLYPFATLARKISDQSPVIDPLSKAALLHFASKASSKWTAELSDAYENVLTSRNCERPSELTNFGDSEIEVYFLRNICTPTIMEDSTAFISVEQVENERIAVCQKLFDADPDNLQVYAEEIKTITRDQNVSSLLHHVESNMIYVDSSGVSSTVRDSLKESFERYLALISSPSLEYQVEQIDKMIKGVMSKLRDADTKDLAAPPSSERIGLFEQMRNYFIDTFALHPAFGLDTNLSTSIRHGVIEGHIRAPFAEEQLLSNWDKATQTWILPDHWRDKLAGAPGSERLEIERIFGRFSTRIGDFVKLYRDELLQIRRPDNKRQGLFFFRSTSDEIKTLADSITTSTSYEEFLALIFDHAWTLVDRAMNEIKARIRGDLLAGLNTASETFATSLGVIPSARNAGILNSIARAKTAMQVKIEEIANWFKRPVDVSETPFEMELALLVSVKQIENCYTGQSLSENHSVEASSKLPGFQLNGFVEILFLLLQNAIKHGGFYTAGRRTPVQIRSYEEEGDIILECINDIYSDVDLDKLKNNSEEAITRHSTDSDLAMAPSEGRSGLSKLKRILRFDIRRDYQISFRVIEPGPKFEAILRIKSETIGNADIRS
ncbi:hypothetical protein [Pseudoxanthomonas sp. z9]|uniref:hypothetical protein n=1 Tax=Pseudoxanthomonas sp. z9 TaxID=2584942 RepID=UPI00114448AF|nr:hypothetical protein [Pseudoxanthomonas sp. z9]